MSLTGMPKGYAPYAKEWFAPFLRHKVFLVRTRLSKAAWTSGAIAKDFADHTLKCASLIRFGQSE